MADSGEVTAPQEVTLFLKRVNNAHRQVRRLRTVTRDAARALRDLEDACRAHGIDFKIEPPTTTEE